MILMLNGTAHQSHDGHGAPRRRSMARRATDIAAAIALLAITFPLMVLAALAIRIESPGPILLREAHLGEGGRVFTLLTFRCVRWSGALQPPVPTQVGRLLQRPRIDQLPVLFNLLRGEMTLIGPPPARLSGSGPRAVVPAATPGLSGWASLS
ncbi:hypothetical protein D9599_17515 [Roseomonas sp. KE2513]|nr:hypothetical protein [Roseomonas sp. KE2513]